MGSYRIAVIRGDGIGPEVVDSTIEVLYTLQDAIKGLELKFDFVEAGDECYKLRGVPLPEETIEAIRRANAALKGPVGESAADVIVKLRQVFDLYANVRPFKSYPGVPSLRDNIDFVIIRENTEDLYKRYEFAVNGGDTTIALRVITKRGCERIARTAFELASRRPRRHVTIVHKSNVLSLTCGLFARVCKEVAKKYPEVSFEEMYVDSCAYNLVIRPERFDVIVTTNMFGDILSDEAAAVVGSLGIAPAANIGDKQAIFEPVHGSAPDIAGKGIANPCATMLSAKMMLEWLGENEAARLLEDAIISVLKDRKNVTPDLGGRARTKDFMEAVKKAITG
ncbi:MAG: isocitrate/isopropylmalate dehydrogenase family protein [Candidatus Nezhaarchaeota archaeon]|nr:isocitrate/isopropylmalate dehydrogenase family protein [Candidatus Nezhaarchaeota archaeon]MCX8141416.1 isocitrate/isopropylmalate dehydrogenase family protein [Candidatus Nezhaarchaeota archaeon]MDW8049682.1 isocitrate/isopropylmalate dehydrogenase family protein [Nitrososphaerota archaeon]